MLFDLAGHFPIYKVENDLMLSRSGEITAAYRLELPEIFTLSPADYRELHAGWTKAIRLLEKGTVLHKQDWFTESRFKGDFEKDHSLLSAGSERHFHERPFLSHSCYLMLTKLNRTLPKSSMSGLLRKGPVPLSLINGKTMTAFSETLGQVEKVLSDAGMELHRLSVDALTGSRQRAGLLERYLFLKGDRERRQLSDIAFKPDWRIGDKRVLMYSMADAEDLPGSVSVDRKWEKYATDRTDLRAGFAMPLGEQLSCNHLYNQYIVVGDGKAKLKELEAKRLRMESLAAYSRENALSRDATAEFLNEAISEGKDPVRAHFNLVLWTEDHGNLSELRNSAAAALSQMDVVPRQETLGAPQLFWAGLPGNEGELPTNECFDTFAQQAVCLFNMETHYRSSPSPIGMRLGDRISGRPVNVDLSDEPMAKGLITNRNKFVLGPSGSGKSFFTNHMVRSYHAQGSHIVLVDVGHSYRGLCRLLKGYYFTYQEDDPIRFNPFYVEGTIDTEKKESLKTLLLALWKKDDEPYRRSEYVALSNAVTAYYAHLDRNREVFPCFDSFYEFLEGEFREQLHRDGVKETDFDTGNFMYVLRPYYRGGEFDYLLNARENLDLLGQRMIVFELDAIKDHPILFPVVTIIIMEIFIAKMRKLKGVRKMILIEEAWKAIAKEGMAGYIKYLFKTVRKFYGEAIVVTQEVEDIISSPVVKEAIINNSDCKILLDQSKYQNKFGRIQELLGLTEKEAALALSINKANDPKRKYKEVFISLGGQLSKVYRTEVGQEEYHTYSTEESEQEEIRRYTKQFGSLEKAIGHMARNQQQ
ncbi:TraG family conjugative transposon ATPase [Echinicola rosea]|uniref:Transposase n=1 Tax=Echinicola rosea TaxID=1807691 RepID=A0ABQ1VAV3_9BACT|nr:TraG family conjugative transposon ATPase [Echinicola rosea]GGF44164.1 transposase [Echinicola rosea]